MGFIRDHSGNKYTTRNKILKGKTQQKPSIDFLFFSPQNEGKRPSYDALNALKEMYMTH